MMNFRHVSQSVLVLFNTFEMIRLLCRMGIPRQCAVELLHVVTMCDDISAPDRNHDVE